MKKDELLILLEREGFSKRVLDAFGAVRRQDFVPKDYSYYAYENTALSIGHGATISQPYTIAFMLDLLEVGKNDKVLEIGSGCGYVLALFAQLTRAEIIGIEIIEELAKKSKKQLIDKKNVEVVIGDGSKGLKSKELYDKILVSAAFEKIPYHLLDQLKIGGILVSPVKNSIYKIVKREGEPDIFEYPGFVFVPVV